MQVEFDPGEAERREQALALLDGWGGLPRSVALWGHDPGFDPDLMATLARNRWLDIVAGRPGRSLTEAAVVLEVVGSLAVPGPVQASLVQAVAVARASQNRDLAEAVADGRRRPVLCVDGGRLRARRQGRSWVLDGRVPLVAFAVDADTFVVPVGTEDGPTMVLAVAAGEPGLSVEPRATLGGDRAGTVAFHTVVVADEAAFEAEPRILAQARDIAVVAQAAELVGVARGALEVACDWVRSRHQWGQPLGVLQAVQHRAADMYLQVETAALAVYDAAGRADLGLEFAVASSVAKLAALDAALAVTAGAHQLHGGEGYYADRPLGLFFRRARSLAPRLGTRAEHLQRLAGAGPGAATAGLIGAFGPRPSPPG